MKKIILGIITILLAVAIFGCGRVQQSSGGGSSGGGGGGGGNETPQTFSIRGYVSVATAQVSGMSVQDADTYSIKVLKFTDNSQWGGNGNIYTPRSSDGYYEISGLPLGTVFIVEAQKGQTKMRNLAFGSVSDKGQTKTADITPTSTVTVELISANATETLKSFNENTDLTSVVEEAQKEVDKYYEDESKLGELNTAINNGSISGVINDVKDEVLNKLECELTITAANGTVALTPSPNSSNGNVHKYLKNTKVKLLAKGNTGYAFKEWSGADKNDVVNNEIIMNGDKNITAEFSPTVTVYYKIRVPEKWLSAGANHDSTGGWLSFSPNPVSTNTYNATITEADIDAYYNTGDNTNIREGDHTIYEYVYAPGTDVTITAHDLKQDFVYALSYAANPDNVVLGGLSNSSDKRDTESLSNHSGESVQFTLTMDKNYGIFQFSGETCKFGDIASGAKTMDGNILDWSSDPYIYDFTDPSFYYGDNNERDNPNPQDLSDVIGTDQPNGAFRIKSVKAAQDSEYVYFLMEIDSAPTDNPYFMYGIYIDEYHGADEDDAYYDDGYGSSGNGTKDKIWLAMWKHHDGAPHSTYGNSGEVNGWSMMAHYNAPYPHGATSPFQTGDGYVSGQYWEMRVKKDFIKDKLDTFSDYGNRYVIKPHIDYLTPRNGGWHTSRMASPISVIVDEL